jgi:hypothetical protein
MTRKKTEPEIEDDDDVFEEENNQFEIPDDIEPEGKIPQILSFMSQFQNRGDYEINVYIKGDRAKGEKFQKKWLETLYNELPVLDTLRDKWGGGTFMFYVNAGGKMTACPTVTIADRPKTENFGNPDAFDKKNVINEMKEMASLLQSFNPSGGNNSSESVRYDDENAGRNKPFV